MKDLNSLIISVVMTLGVLITFYDLKNCKGNFLDDGDVATDVLNFFGLPVKDIAFEGCETVAYPPTNTNLPPPDEYIIDLDLPPLYRWTQVAQDKAFYISTMLNNLKSYTSVLFKGKLFDYVDRLLPLLGSTLPTPFRQEIQGMSEISGIPYGEMVLYNIFYEIFTVCTSIIAQDTNGKLYHARNLDFGLFLGWDGKNGTWLMTENLKPMVVKLTFTRNNKTLFQAVSFAGYTGILTGLKKDAFTLAINDRFSLKGGFFGIMEWLMGKKDIKWLGFLTREVMENATNYKEAQKLLIESPLLAPAYYVLGGAKEGEGSVITRGQRNAELWTLGQPGGSGQNSSWYLLQTNYDHWKMPPIWDDRRTPAITCMEKEGQKGLGFASLYNVLSTKPMLNKLTTYTALMQVNNGTIDVYLRDCQNPCWPW